MKLRSSISGLAFAVGLGVLVAGCGQVNAVRAQKAFKDAVAAERPAEVVDHDEGAALGQLEGVRAAEAASGTGDHCNLAVVSEISHGCASS